MTTTALESQQSPLFFEIEDLNIMGLPFEDNIPERTTAIQKATNADVSTFQEVYNLRSRYQLRRFSSHPYYSIPSMRIKPVSSGLATVSRHKIIQKKFRPYYAGVNADFFSSKGVQLIQIDHPELGIIDIYNTHLQASYQSPEQHSKTRQKQLKQLIKFIKTHSPTDHTIILNGDFNMLPSSNEYQHLMQSKIGLVDLYDSLYPNKDLNTFKRENAYICGDDISNCTTEQDMRLDYIFVRPSHDLEIDFEKSSGTITEQFNGVTLSDHSRFDMRIAFNRRET